VFKLFWKEDITHCLFPFFSDQMVEAVTVKGRNIEGESLFLLYLYHIHKLS